MMPNTQGAIQAGRLGPGFADPVIDAQVAFRAIMAALARPGLVRTVPGAGPVSRLCAAAVAASLTLLDGDTTVWLAPSLDLDPVRSTLRFHCAAPLTTEPMNATFAIIGEPAEALPLDRFTAGDDQYPDQAATLIIQVPGLTGGPAVTLRGPGVRDQITIAPAGLEPEFWHAWATNHAGYPAGVDILFVQGDKVLGLPRSIAVEA